MFFLALLWVATRAYPFHQTLAPFCWETWQAHKFMQYGFWNRHGIPIEVQHETGIVPEPARFNYINHPLLGVWWVTLLFAAGGPYLVQAFMLAATFASFLVFFWTLTRLFPLRAATLAAALFLLSPAPMIWAPDSNIIAWGALLWPVSLFTLVRARESDIWRRRLPWLLGGAVFVAGQITWMSLSIAPGLLAATASPGTRCSFRGLVAEWRRNAVWRAIGISAAATSILFLSILVLNTSDPHATIKYLLDQTGKAQAQSKSKMILFDILRIPVLAGIPLSLFALAALWLCFKQRKSDPVVMAAIVYLPSFALIGMVLARFFFIESTPYVYLAYALTILSASAFSQLNLRYAPALAVCLAVPNLIHTYLNISFPPISPAAEKLGQVIAEHAEPTDIVMTNLEVGHAPFAPTDMSVVGGTRKVSDRSISFGVKSAADVTETAKPFPHSTLIYVLDTNLAVTPELRALLDLEKLWLKSRFGLTSRPPVWRRKFASPFGN